MNLQNKSAGDMDDPVLREALKNFKASVDAWSDAAYNRPRTMVNASVRRRGWRLAASWALGCMLVAGGLTAGLYQRHHNQELAKIAAEKSAAQKAAQERAAVEQKVAAAQQALPQEQAAVEERDSAATAGNADDELLATIASDVSRQVPSAMEPLAQMMDDSGSLDKGNK